MTVVILFKEIGVQRSKIFLIINALLKQFLFYLIIFFARQRGSIICSDKYSSYILVDGYDCI